MITIDENDRAKRLNENSLDENMRIWERAMGNAFCNAYKKTGLGFPNNGVLIMTVHQYRAYVINVGPRQWRKDVPPEPISFILENLAEGRVLAKSDDSCVVTCAKVLASDPSKSEPHIWSHANVTVTPRQVLELFLETDESEGSEDESRSLLKIVQEMVAGRLTAKQLPRSVRPEVTKFMHVAGCTNQEIENITGISDRTRRRHVKAFYASLSADNVDAEFREMAGRIRAQMDRMLGQLEGIMRDPRSSPSDRIAAVKMQTDVMNRAADIIRRLRRP